MKPRLPYRQLFLLGLTLLWAWPPENLAAQIINQPKYVPDENLRRELANSLGKDPSAPITLQEAKHFTGELKAIHFKYMKGLELFPNITSLVIGNRFITELDLSGFQRLSKVKILCASLQSINIEQNHRLVSFEMILSSHNPGNKLAWTFEFTNNPRLQLINLHNMALQSVDVSACPELNTLSCCNAKKSGREIGLTELDLSNNGKLVSLQVWGNQLKRLDVSHNPKLAYLDCLYNPLEEVALSNSRSLIDLKVDDGFLTPARLRYIKNKGVMNILTPSKQYRFSR